MPPLPPAERPGESPAGSSRAPTGPLRGLLRDARELLPRGEALLWFGLVAAVLLQVGYWYLGSPGPTLLRFAPRDPRTALLGVLWAAVLLGLAPVAIWRAWGRSVRELGLRLGDWRAGLPLAGALALLAAPLLWLGTADPAVQATYPWPGAWAGRSVPRLLAWTGLYALYYLSFELFYRGFLLRLVTPFWGPRAALWLQATCATLIHLGKPLAETLAAFPASLLFGLLAVRTRSLLWPVLLHLAIGLVTDLASLQRQGWLLP